MNLSKWLAALSVLLALAGLRPSGNGAEQPPSAPHPYNDDGRMDRSRDMM